MIESQFQNLPAKPTTPSWPPPQPSAVPPAPPDEVPIDSNLLLLAVLGLILFLAVHRNAWYPIALGYWNRLFTHKQLVLLFIPEKIVARVSKRLKNL